MHVLCSGAPCVVEGPVPPLLVDGLEEWIDGRLVKQRESLLEGFCGSASSLKAALYRVIALRRLLSYAMTFTSLSIT